MTQITSWRSHAIRVLTSEERRSGMTPLHLRRFPNYPGIDFYFKDEALQPSGSLKHRLARSLLMRGILTGRIGPGTTIVEASSGSTAVSLAYFAELLELPFCAVIPPGTAAAKVEAIRNAGGEITEAESSTDLERTARAIASNRNGFFLNQFGEAANVTSWSDGSLADDVFRQLEGEKHRIPHAIVSGAGTGGTASGIARYVRFHSHPTRIILADPEGSVYADALETGDRALRAGGSRIEGVGRPCVEASFQECVFDAGYAVPDAASVAAARVLRGRLGINAGGSTGTNFAAAMCVADQMVRDGQSGAIVVVLADGAERYLDTYFCDDWCAATLPRATLLEGLMVDHLNSRSLHAVTAFGAEILGARSIRPRWNERDEVAA